MIGFHPVLEILLGILLLLSIIYVFVVTNRKINREADQIILLRGKLDLLADQQEEAFRASKESCGCSSNSDNKDKNNTQSFRRRQAFKSRSVKANKESCGCSSNSDDKKDSETYLPPSQLWNNSSAMTTSKNLLLPTKLQNEYLNDKTKQYPNSNATRSNLPLNSLVKDSEKIEILDENSITGRINSVGDVLTQPLNSTYIGERTIQMGGKDRVDGDINYKVNLPQANSHIALYDQADENSFSPNGRVNAAYTKNLLPMNGM